MSANSYRFKNPKPVRDPDPEQRRWTAIHEAGHAVSAIYSTSASKLWWTDIMLGGGDELGLTIAEINGTLQPRFLLAGMAAELEFGRDWWLALAGARGDLLQLTEFCPKWRAHAPTLMTQTKMFCSRHRYHIEALAEHLLQYPEGVGERQAVEILRQACPPTLAGSRHVG